MHQKRAFLGNLRERTLNVKAQTEQLLQLPDHRLLHRPAAKKWNAIECIEHLNLYGDFYLPEIEASIRQGNKGNETFKSSWIGNYFAKSVAPVDPSIGKNHPNPMKTFKDKNPTLVAVRNHPLKVFLKQQEKTLDLLEAAHAIDLTKTKTAISISKLIKLRLGDTFRVLIYHNQRHMEQAMRAVKEK